MSARYRQHGFTILELLISMTLTALLLGMLSAGVYSVVNDWQRETAGLDTELDKALVLLQIERALLGAFPHTYVDDETVSRYVYFHGDAEELRFVSTVSPQRQEGLTGWNLISDPERGLQLRLTPAFADDPDTRLDLLEPVTLLAGYEARFRYLVQADIDDKLWLEQWPRAEYQSLPLAVEVVLTPHDDRGGETLEVLAPIRANRHAEITPTLPVLR